MLDIKVNLRIKTPTKILVRDRICVAIQRGEISRGAFLPPIKTIIAESQVSRDSIDKAYRQLVHEGILRLVKGRGYQVV